MSTYDPRASLDQAWQATRAQTALATQILRNEDEYLAGPKPDIGRQVAPGVRELFVSCEPALALRQQFEHLQPEFIAVHDVGTASSRKLVAGIASAAGSTMHKLVIRRQGFGTPLATLEYVELPIAEGRQLRLYTTESEADTTSRQGVARMLLGFSRLGVLMVGDLPAHVLAATLKPLHDDMLAGPWPNRQLLFLPLASASTVAAQGMDMARSSGVSVRTTPQVTRPADAWSYIGSTWARMIDPSLPAAPASAAPAAAAVPARPAPAPAPAPAPVVRPPSPPPATRPAALARAVAADTEDTQPMVLSMRPMPDVAVGRTRIAERPQAGVLDLYVRRLAELTGMVSCCVFDIASSRALAHAGARPAAEELARHGAELMAGIAAGSRALGLGHAVPDAAITLGAHHLVLRAVPRHPGLAMHAVLDKSSANLTLARLQIQRLDALFDEAAA